MMEIMEHTFNGKQIRTKILENGEVWFVANDLMTILDIKSQAHALRKLDDDQRGEVEIQSPMGIQKYAGVSESGLYDLVMQSSKPQARPFQKWVTKILIPSVRKTGQYTVGQDNSDLEIMNDPDVKMMREMVENTIHRKKQAKMNAQLLLENAVLKERVSNVETNFKNLTRHRRGDDKLPHGMISLNRIRSKYFNGISLPNISEYLKNKKHPSEQYTYVINDTEQLSYCYLEDGLEQLAAAFFKECSYVGDTPKNIKVTHPMVDGIFWVNKQMAPIHIQNNIVTKRH